MTKEKKSFLEKLTGTKRIEEETQEETSYSMPIQSDDQETFMEMNTTPTPQPETQPATPPSQPVSEEWEDTGDADGQLTIDMYQTDTEVVIKSTIAGVRPEDLDVSINNDMITIKGDRHMEEEIQQDNYYYQECYWGSFSRSVVLPVDVLPEKIEASLKNGILTIRLPKADTNTVKKIQVRGF